MLRPAAQHTKTEIMKKLLLIVVLFLPFGVFAQYFNYLHTYDTTADGARNIVLLQDNSLLVTGANFGLNSSHENACWWHISPNGDSILNKKSVHTDANAYYIDYSHNLIPLTSGGYLLPYTQHYYANDPDRFYNIASLVFLDAQLDTVAISRYTDTSLYSENFFDCALLHDGSFMLGGSRNSSYSSQQNSGSIKGMVKRIDAQGNLMWSRVYQKEPGKLCYMMSVQPLDSNRTLIGGNSTDVLPIGTWYYNRNKPWFVIIDNTNGDILKDTLYPPQYAGYGWIYKDVNGGYYHSGTKDSVVVQNVNDNTNFPAYISHLDTNFNMEWVTSLPHSYQPYGKYAIRLGQLQNGDFLMSGAGIHNTGWAHGWVARVSGTGAIIWSKYYYSQSNKQAYLTDFVERPDGNIVLCGWTSNDTVESWRGQELWLLGLYASGVVLTGTGSIGNVQVKTMEFDIYPNPASETFYLDVPEPGLAELYDMSGKRVAKYDVPEKGKVELRLDDRIAAGNYLLQFTGGESKMVAGKQLIKK